jgi:DASH complex subunit DAM1
MEHVIEGIMKARDQTVKCMHIPSNVAFPSKISALLVLDLIKPPDLNQARVNICLIALVNRKVVQKDNGSVSRNPSNLCHSLILVLQGTVLYRWRGLP